MCWTKDEIGLNEEAVEVHAIHDCKNFRKVYFPEETGSIFIDMVMKYECVECGRLYDVIPAGGQSNEDC